MDHNNKVLNEILVCFKGLNLIILFVAVGIYEDRRRRNNPYQERVTLQAPNAYCMLIDIYKEDYTTPHSNLYFPW